MVWTCGKRWVEKQFEMGREGRNHTCGYSGGEDVTNEFRLE